MKPKISIIVPCYNVEPYIDRCLNVLQNQTLKDVEIICIDDKSTDGTLAIIRKHARADKRIRVIAHKSNTGAAIARNAGLDIATGEFIGFVDPDDWVDNDFYEKLYDYATKTKSDVAKANVIQTDTNTGFISEHWLNKYVRRDTLYFMATFWSAIYNHKFLLKHNIRFPDEIRTSQDAVFLAQVTLHTNKIAVIDNTYYHYFYQRAGSLDSATLSHWKAESKLNAFKINLELIEKSNLSRRRLLLAIHQHVLVHALYELNKNYENISDHQAMFYFTSDVLAKYPCIARADCDVSKQIYKSLKKQDFAAFMKYKSLSRVWYYLLHFIPFINIDTIGSTKVYYLFNVFPLLRTFENRRFYLFGIIPILKVKK